MSTRPEGERLCFACQKPVAENDGVRIGDAVMHSACGPAFITPEARQTWEQAPGLVLMAHQSRMRVIEDRLEATERELAEARGREDAAREALRPFAEATAEWTGRSQLSTIAVSWSDLERARRALAAPLPSAAPVSFGARLRDARVAAGLSLREAAALFGVSVVRFGEVERGVAEPSGAAPERGETGWCKPGSGVLGIAVRSGEVYRHFKGREYRVLCIGLWEPTAEPCVVYTPMDGESVWVRPLSAWTEEAEPGVSRFRLVEPAHPTGPGDGALRERLHAAIVGIRRQYTPGSLLAYCSPDLADDIEELLAVAPAQEDEP